MGANEHEILWHRRWKLHKESMIEFSLARALTPGQIRDLLERSTLAERRPVDHPDTIAGMVANGNLCVTGWDGISWWGSRAR